MAHPCPDSWPYEQHPKRKKLLARVVDVIKRLRSRQLDGVRASQDSRPVHSGLFEGLTPPHFTYFAGHYRGEPFHCLEFSTVRAGNDPRTGTSPDMVAQRIDELKNLIARGVAEADNLVASGTLPEHEKMQHVVAFACRIFDLFLQVHPYVNGNGHVARFIVWAILGRYGFWPVRWTIEPRPPNPPYIPYLLEHRGGNGKPLVEWVLNCIK